MIQNKKIWFFTEGQSEYLFVTWLIRNHFYWIENCKDEVAFIESRNDSVCYITDCKNGQKIPYEISDSYYKVKQAGPCDIVVVCDLEKDPCPIQRKDNLIKSFHTEIKTEDIKFVFSNPILEEIYCFEYGLTAKILRNYFQAKYNNDINSIDSTSLNVAGKSPLYKIQRFFKIHKLTFKKIQFADKFFSQFNYMESTNKTVIRLVSFLNEKYNLKEHVE